MDAIVKDNLLLIEGLKSGRKDLFKVIFEMYYQPLSSFGNKYISNLATLEDFVQEAFVTYWEKRDNFDNITAIKSFLYTTLRNSCLNYLKHLGVKRKHEGSIAYELESEHYFNDNVIEEETFNQLYLEIKNLPKSAQAIMLLALNGLKNPEIAAELDISENTVKTQKKLAYSKLRDRLSPVLQILILSL